MKRDCPVDYFLDSCSVLSDKVFEIDEYIYSWIHVQGTFSLIHRKLFLSFSKYHFLNLKLTKNVDGSAFFWVLNSNIQYAEWKIFIFVSLLRVGRYVFRPIFNIGFKHTALVKAERH